MNRSANWKAVPPRPISLWVIKQISTFLHLPLSAFNPLHPPPSFLPYPKSHPQAHTQTYPFSHSLTHSHPLPPSLTLSRPFSPSLNLPDSLTHPLTHVYHHPSRCSALLPWLHPRYHQNADLVGLLSHIKALHHQPGVH